MNRTDLHIYIDILRRDGIVAIPNASPTARSYIAGKVGHGSYRSFFLPDGRLVMMTVEYVTRLLEPLYKATTSS